MIIIGAGLAGCIAGTMLDPYAIYESGGNKTTHNAILRFRTDAISKATGIPFKKVKVYKGIWHNNEPVALSPRYISLYARKVSNRVSHRSICNLDTVNRYIAPDHFHEILRERLADKIVYEYPNSLADISDKDTEVISTMPLDIVASHMGMYKFKDSSPQRSSIYVNTLGIENCDAYMTMYFTDPNTSIYRASLTGNKLIIESYQSIDADECSGTKKNFGMSEIHYAKKALGVSGMLSNFELKNSIQRYGKISDVGDNIRKEIIYDLTHKYNTYSLGRFATWRNIVLDDVYKDIQHINSMRNKSNYDRCIA